MSRRPPTPSFALRRFFANVAPWCVAVTASAAFSAARAAVAERQILEQFVAEADAGRPVFQLMDAAGDYGVAAAMAGAEFLDEQKPARSQALYELISLTANCRRRHADILRLYQPAAFHLFYAPDGVATQRQLAKGLEWKNWPAALPEAVVRAAPIPTLEWLRKQAQSQAPEREKLRMLLPPLGWWLRAYNERQSVADFQAALGAMTANAALTGDEPTCLALLHALADTRAVQSLDFVLQQFRAATPERRAAAVESAGQILYPEPFEDTHGNTLDAARIHALPEFLRLTREETDATVLAKAGPAAESWMEEPQIGQAMLALFTRVSDALTQRNILFAVAKTRWPQRGQIIQRGLEATGNGVLGVALEAIAAHPLPELAPATLALLEAQKEIQPSLIDAAGALGDPHALPTLLRWLSREKNMALQLKLALALEKIPGAESSRALADLLNNSADPMIVEQLCRMASRREIQGATPTLVSLAEDLTAPLPIRCQAVWTLGRYQEPAARECLARLTRDPEKYFPAAGNALVPEGVEQARIYIPLARWRQGDTSTGAEITTRFASGTPSTQLVCLLAFAELRCDHPVISTALNSGDFAVLLGSVRAAGAAAPAKYSARLRALRASPVISVLSVSGLDTSRLSAALETSIHAGEQESAKP